MRLARVLPPGSTIGILGGGQLARMLSLAAARLGIDCHIYAPEADSPAFQVAARHTVAPYTDLAALADFAGKVDAVTYEFENVPGGTATFLEQRVALAPSASALVTAQDRLDEKSFIAGLGIEVAPFQAVDDVGSLDQALARLGRPSILKTRRLGYDGKGQTRIDMGKTAAEAWTEIGKAPAILEGFVAFDSEVSVIAARGWDASMAIYDVTENHHENHILRRSIVPARISSALADEAHAIASKLIAALGYVGVIGIEMFVSGNRLLVNELAPRVHNSGHWTMDACAVSQFEQHIRAVSGWPLGSTTRHSDVIMTNLLGDEAGDWERLAAEPGTALHLYGKRVARRTRKMGHVNRLTPRQA